VLPATAAGTDEHAMHHPDRGTGFEGIKNAVKVSAAASAHRRPTVAAVAQSIIQYMLTGG
jgi:hypothetical protein